jgi:hypothetical protein
MTLNTFFAWCIYGLYAPFLIILLILVHYVVQRILWRRRKRRGLSGLGFYPSAFALGMAMQFLQTFHRPSVAYVLQAKRDEDAEEDDEGDPESFIKQLSRQLRRIRRGEPVEQLVLRM